MTHTPTPWRVCVTTLFGTQLPDGSFGALIGDTGRSSPTLAEACANAERIVACVNACEGVDTLSLVGASVRELIEQNEVLRASGGNGLDALPHDDDTGAAMVMPHFIVIGGNAYWREQVGALGSHYLMSAPLDAVSRAVRWDDGCECDPEGSDYAAIMACLKVTS